MGSTGTPPYRRYRKRRWRRVRKSARNWSFVLDDTPPPAADGRCWRNLPRTRRRCSWDAGVTDSSAERREKIGLEVRNQSTSCTGSAIEVVMPYMF